MTDDIKNLIAEAKSYPMPRAALETEIACARFIVRLCDALESEHGRAEETSEVLAGADHTAAKYWRRMKGAEFARNRLAEERNGLADDLVKTGEDADRYMAERDALRTAIQSLITDLDDARAHGEIFTYGMVQNRLSRAIDTKEKSDDEA